MNSKMAEIGILDCSPSSDTDKMRAGPLLPELLFPRPFKAFLQKLIDLYPALGLKPRS